MKAQRWAAPKQACIPLGGRPTYASTEGTS